MYSGLGSKTGEVIPLLQVSMLMIGDLPSRWGAFTSRLLLNPFSAGLFSIRKLSLYTTVLSKNL